jgi:hypothetical protein
MLSQDRDLSTERDHRNGFSMAILLFIEDTAHFDSICIITRQRKRGDEILR